MLYVLTVVSVVSLVLGIAGWLDDTADREANHD